MSLPGASRYSFQAYASAWPEAFSREATVIETILNGVLITIHHIGSTSVPGLAAKPIIDILPVVTKIESVDGLSESFETEGYIAKGENGLPGRRYFTKDRDRVRTHNVHIFEEGNPEIERHLAFCAYLRHHPLAQMEYEKVKRACCAHFPSDIESYNNCKTDWIVGTEKIAIPWFRNLTSTI